MTKLKLDNKRKVVLTSNKPKITNEMKGIVSEWKQLIQEANDNGETKLTLPTIFSHRIRTKEDKELHYALSVLVDENPELRVKRIENVIDKYSGYTVNEKAVVYWVAKESKEELEKIIENGVYVKGSQRAILGYLEDFDFEYIDIVKNAFKQHHTDIRKDDSNATYEIIVSNLKSFVEPRDIPLNEKYIDLSNK